MNENIEKIIKYNSLLNIYGELLSKTQKEILTSYYEYNLSISEIADEKNISRAAVEDAIKKGINKLDDFENKLNCLNNKNKTLDLLKKFNESKDKKYLEEIERMNK